MQYTNINFIIATFFGLGKISGRIAGSIGSLVAFPVTFYCFKLTQYLYQNNIFKFKNLFFDTFTIPLLLIVILFIIGTITARQYIKHTSNHDPKEVIIDEIVGQMLCLILTVPPSFKIFILSLTKYPLDILIICVFIANFVLFRICDILKPWPIRWCEKKFKGGFGIMFDDILAAIFATVIYYIIFFKAIEYLV